MIRLILIGLLLSVAFISGCTQQGVVEETGTLTEAQLSDLDDTIEQEMEGAIDNINLEEIEDLITE
jgi:outer membrane lipoprotein-sorting protein